MSLASCPVLGSMPICPEQTIQSPARTAGEYGPAAGVFGVEIGSGMPGTLGPGGGAPPGRPDEPRVVAEHEERERRP